MMFWIRFAGMGDFSDLGEVEILERFRNAFTTDGKREIHVYVFSQTEYIDYNSVK